MTVLLRHPARVPSLFSPAPEADGPPRARAFAPRMADRRLFVLAWGCGAAMLVDVPLVKAAGVAAARFLAA